MKRFLTLMMVMMLLAPMASYSSPQYRSSESTFFFDFDNNSLEGWKTIDRDEDGNNWLISEDGYIYSESANAKPNNVIATTDKYAIYATSKISFDVRPLSTENYAENYGIVYSEDGEYFYTIHNVTLESSAEWTNVEFALDYCAGKEIYIGILHNSVENQSAILVDNVKLTDGKLPTVKQVVATENGDNVNVTWNVPATENVANEFCGYRVYRSNGDDSNAPMIANDLTETSYTDATWAEAEQGVYKYGVAALYKANAKRGNEILLEEGFEDYSYPNLPTGWTYYSDPATAASTGNWMTSTGIGVYKPISGVHAAFSSGWVSQGSNYYLVTPALDFTTSLNLTLDFMYISPGWSGAASTIRVAYSESATGPWTELWKYEGSGETEWVDASVNISAVSGKVVYLAFIATDNMGFGAGIDDIVITATGGTGDIVPVASDIVWSNTVDKNMTRTVNVTVAANDNASVAGATVSLVNKDDATYTYNATLDETGVCQLTDVRVGTYNYTIVLEGYYNAAGQIEVAEDTNINCTLEAKPDTMEGLYVSPTAWAMWKDYAGEATSFDVKLNGEVVAQNITERYYQHEISSLKEEQEYVTTVVPVGVTGSVLEYTWTYQACYNFATPTDLTAEVNDEGNAVLTWTMPTYEPEADPVYSFTTDFNNNTLSGWTTIDADGDGYNWLNSAEFVNEGPSHDGTHCAVSLSYDNEDGALSPDNYLVSEVKYAISSDSKLTFRVAAQSNTYPDEHYGVAISKKSNTNTNDFQVIFEETLTAGNVEEGSIQGEWFERTIDLSEYANQRIYIAFRHFNSANNYWINLDNIALTSSTRGTTEENGEWLFYDNGIYESATGNFDMNGSATQLYWAIMFPADLIADYAGKTLTKVAVYDNCAYNGAFSIHRGGDSGPGEMVHVQSFQATGSKQYLEIELDSPVVIGSNDNIWIQFSNEYGSGTYPAAYSADMGDPNSRWRSDNGSYWYDSNWYGEGWYGTWMIRAFVSNETGPMPDAPTVTSVEPLGTIIFRNGELITPEPIQGNSFTEALNDDENVEYTIRVVYGGEKDLTYYAMSCPLSKNLVTEEPLVCTPPQNLYGTGTFNEDGTFGATLVWPYVKEWLYYDDGEVVSAIGGGGTIYWGVMFPAEDLATYAGTSLTKVLLFDFEAGDATLSISYGGDSKPGTTVHSQNFTFSGTQEMFELELTYPMPISGEENVWITLYQSGAQFPAAVTNTTGDANGRWCSLDGNAWGDLTEMNAELTYTWFLRAYVANEAKGGQVYEIEKVQGNVGSELSTIKLAQPKTVATSREEATLDHYNVYRSTTNGNYELIEETTDNRYFDEIEQGTYYYQVTAVYKRGEETCESEPAKSYSDATADYVVVEVTTINENDVKGLMIYPNPTKGNLNITAENMNRITVLNTLGQVMYDSNVNSDNEIIDMTQYKAGVYMVRIATENGVTVKRISVVR